MPTQGPDTELLVRFRDGDTAAFAELMHRYKDAIYGYLCRCGLREATRDDLFQEIFIKVDRAAATFAPERPFKPWLFKVAVNTVRSHFRKRELLATDIEACEPASPEPSSEALMAAKETAEWLEAAISRLPLAQREVVILVCAEQMAQVEVAEMLALPVNTVKTLLRRARITLARWLAARNARAAREADEELS